MNNTHEQLETLVNENSGLLKVSAAFSLGISAPTVYKFARQKGLKRLAKGIYITPHAWIDDLKIISYRWERAVLSHETALMLHGLAEREPANTTVTVPSGYNASSLKKAGIKTFFIKPALLDLGKTTVNSFEGHSVTCYDMERTICDIVRSRSNFESQTIISALKNYAGSPKKNLLKLNKYAQQLGVSNLLSTYLEVLL